MPKKSTGRWGWTLDKKTTLLVLTAVALVAATGRINHDRLASFEESSQWVAHTHEVKTGLESIQAALVEGETGMRGYLLTGDEPFLEPYQSAIVVLPKEMRAVRKLTDDNPNQQRFFNTLEPLVAREMAVLRELVESRPKGPGVPPPQGRLAEGKEVMDEIRGVLKDMQGEEERLLTLRLEKASITGRTTTLALAGSTLLALLTLAGAVLLVNRNVARRLRAEGELRQSENRYRLLFEKAKDAILVADEEAHYVDANGEAERLTGYTREELVRLTLADLTPALSRNGGVAKYQEFKRQGHMAGEYELLRKDGSTVAVEFSANRVGEGRYQSILRNITERKKAQDERHRLNEELEAQVRERTEGLLALRNQNDLLSEIIATQQAVATAALDFDGVMKLIAGRTQQLTGASGAVVELLEGDEMVYRAATGTAASSLGFRLKSATSLSGMCVRTGKTLRCDDAEVDDRVDKQACRKVGVRSMVVVPLILDHKPVGVLKVLSPQAQGFVDRDMQTLQLMAGLIAASMSHAAAFEAERTLVAERTGALRASEERYRRIVETTPDGIWTLDADSRTTFVNQRMAQLLGFAVEEMAGRLLFEFMDEEARVVAEAKVERRRQGVSEQHDFRFRRKDGTDLWALVSAAPIFEGGQNVGALAVVTDITERKLLEEQLRQAQKMEAVGQLAGGVAHDFNNLLTIISGYSEMMLASLRPDDRSRDMIRAIYDAGERAAQLTRQLLTFSRKQVVEPRILDLNGIVSGTDKMLQRLIGEDVGLATVLAPALNRVKADAGQIEQVIVNLAVNARDAMPHGGRLTIETANVDLDENYGESHAEVKPGRYVLLAVSDTGCGMTEEVQRHIFEPFFTTKEPGKGTGLGLATVFGIVKQSGGHIWLYSEVGRGTTFKIYLPSVEEVAPAEKSKDSLAAAPSGTGTILLVEDDDQVRAMTRFVLQGFGYTILEARNGEEAVRVCQTHEGRVDLLITDVVMPGMSGRQVAEAMTRLQPTIRVLYVSGYTDDAVVRHGVLQAETAFLQKPFSTLALAQKVRNVLDQ